MTCGLNPALKKARGLVTKQMAKARGVQFDYTLFTNIDSDPPVSTTIRIYGIPTPTDWELRQLFGLAREDTRDIYVFSYLAFVVNDVEYRPTVRDFFYDVPTKNLKYKVRDVQEPDQYGAKFALLIHTDRDQYARG